MKQFHVTGMSCAACSARVEKAVTSVPGVTSCSVSLLTNSMGVEGNAADASIIQAVQNAGYGASVMGANTNQQAANADRQEMLEDKETPRMKRRLFSSVIVLLVLMYFSMGHMMWGWPIPAWFEGNHVAMGLLQMLLTIIVMLINRKFFISGFKGLLHRAPNMDTLVAMGSSASFLYSVYALFAMTNAQLHGGSEAAAVWMHEFYFESAAMILTLITVGKTLEAYSKGKTTSALKGLLELAPKTAVLLRNDVETEVQVEEVVPGDIFIVRPGTAIPVDGIILEGSSALDESALTGESIPVDKAEGDKVSAGTMNTSGFLRCQATNVGEDTTLNQIIKMVSDAAATKAPIAKTADKVSGIFVPAVISVSFVTLIVWLLTGAAFSFALTRAVSVLVISCPCALGLATPVAIMVGNGVGARNGILFKTAVSLEQTGRTRIVVLDKTGTITHGMPRVTDIVPANGVGREELIATAYALEKRSEHPLAKAIVSYAEELSVAEIPVADFAILPGNGLTGSIGGMTAHGGNLRYISTAGHVDQALCEASEKLASEGKTPLFFEKNHQILGVIAVADTIKEDSPDAIRALKNMGIRVVMLTGDHQATAEAIGRQAEVDEVIAGVLPNDKEAVVAKLRKSGAVMMVGDGVNDAPALTRADVGVAIGAGTDVAVDAADVVLMNSRLTDVPAAIRLSRATLRNIHENLFWAFIYNVIGIPLAAGCLIHLLGWQMSPMFGAAAMSLSSFCVVSNALRLNLINIHSAKRDKKIRKAKESKKMEKTVKIQGMMCPHCENHVKKALEAFAQVDEAVVSHVSGTAVLTLNADLADAEIQKAVEDAGYKYLG